MNDALTKALYDEFPQLYAGHTKSAEHSSMSWGFECGNGWHALLRRLSRQLTDFARQNPGFQLEAIQVKAKVGELKFYLAQRSETTDALIE